MKFQFYELFPGCCVSVPVIQKSICISSRMSITSHVDVGSHMMSTNPSFSAPICRSRFHLFINLDHTLLRGFHEPLCTMGCEKKRENQIHEAILVTTNVLPSSRHHQPPRAPKPICQFPSDDEQNFVNPGSR